MRFAIPTFIVGLIVVTLAALNDTWGIMILPLLVFLVVVLAVAVYAMAKVVDADD